MRPENRLDLGNLSICPPLTSKTGNLDFDDFPRLEEIASHTLIDRGGKRIEITDRTRKVRR
jgi:hypothetical protein